MFPQLDKLRVTNIINQCLDNFDDGELFLEETTGEAVTIADGIIESASFDASNGFGLRGVIGETCSFASSSILDEKEIEKASKIISSASTSGKIIKIEESHSARKSLYSEINPIESVSLAQKIEILKEIDGYIRSKSEYVRQVFVSVITSMKNVEIYRPGGLIMNDSRPMTQVSIRVIAEKNGRKESGVEGFGGRQDCKIYLEQDNIRKFADKALDIALINLESIAGPAGELPIILACGWPGILLHEAVGHGLEGDFNRKKTSIFSDKMGKQVASKGVTVIDDGTIQGRRGSLNFDDEGTPTQKNVLIEDGILTGYMQDRLNARLMGQKLTGNGRRQSYEYLPMPRMTNTFMLGGKDNFDDLVKEIKNGVFAKTFSGGQVDITSGDFVFSATESYLIENGKITSPIKEATLIGNGPEIIKRIHGICNDMALDNGPGHCGKEGQSVPVGVGMPSIFIDKITIGGSKV